ncbi:tetratricopeptide repeat protein [Coralliovum pocilloporae]|uniref:tetratricopeptide repeat protein n=1 Tax=Coralliovum pocilloporae TaxID=3066369 RepID=UPI0033077431
MGKGKKTIIIVSVLAAGMAASAVLYHGPGSQMAAKDPPIDPQIVEAVRQARSLQKAGKVSEAFIELERLSALGHPTAMFYLAKAYMSGWGVEPDLEEARELLLDAVQYTFDLRGESAYKLGRLYEQSTGENCQTVAVAWFMKALKWNYPKAHRQLAIHYEQGIGVEKNIDLALEHYELAAEAGFETVSLRVARLYAAGRSGLDVDAARAQALAERAILAYEVKAANGSGTAAKVIGRLYRDGEFVRQSDAKAMYWFRRSSLLGDPGGMHEFALLATTVMAQDKQILEEALDWLKKAAMLNHGGAMTALGRLHLHEKFGLQREGAIPWFEKGVKASHGGSMEELARLKARGELVPKDLRGALALAQQGADLGHRGARKLLKDLRSGEMTAVDEKPRKTS